METVFNVFLSIAKTVRTSIQGLELTVVSDRPGCTVREEVLNELVDVVRSLLMKIFARLSTDVVIELDEQECRALQLSTTHFMLQLLPGRKCSFDSGKTCGVVLTRYLQLEVCPEDNHVHIRIREPLHIDHVRDLRKVLMNVDFLAKIADAKLFTTDIGPVVMGLLPSLPLATVLTVVLPLGLASLGISVGIACSLTALIYFSIRSRLREERQRLARLYRASKILAQIMSS